MADSINFMYKDTVFRMLFSDKTRLLSLYNALNRTHYSDPDELIVVTLEHAIYMEVKNDIAFLIADSLHLYEHQSTRNPNMPVTPYGVTYEFASANSHTIIVLMMTTKEAYTCANQRN